MTSQSIKIQEITPHYVSDVDPRQWPHDAFLIAFQALNVQRGLKLVALQGKEEVGFMAYEPFEDYCEVISLASKYWNKGIGKRLITEVMVLGPVRVTSNIASEGFYEKLGFVHDGWSGSEKVYQHG